MGELKLVAHPQLQDAAAFTFCYSSSTFCPCLLKTLQLQINLCKPIRLEGVFVPLHYVSFILSFIIACFPPPLLPPHTLEVFARSLLTKKSRESMAGIPSLDLISESTSADGKCCQETNGFLGDKQDSSHCV